MKHLAKLSAHKPSKKLYSLTYESSGASQVQGRVCSAMVFHAEQTMIPILGINAEYDLHLRLIDFLDIMLTLTPMRKNPKKKRRTSCFCSDYFYFAPDTRTNFI